MGYPLQIAYKYLGARNRGAFVSLGTILAALGVTLGVAALLTVMSVTGGFQAQFREKVLGVNAHVLVLKYSSDFSEYRKLMDKMKEVPGVIGVAPFTINPMMVTHRDKTATGVLLKGIDPALMPQVLDLPKHIVEPKPLEAGQRSIDQLRLPGTKAPERKGSSLSPMPLQPLPSPGDSLDAGVAERDDAGRNLTLLRAIERELEDLERKADAGALHEQAADAGAAKKKEAGAAKTPEAGTEEESADKPLPKNAIVGSAEPEGGYASELPDTSDDLPEDVAPDPCTDPAQVSKLPGIVVGSTLAKNLDLGIGSCVQVTSPTIGFSYVAGAIKPPVAKQFRVVAIFEAGFDQYDYSCEASAGMADTCHVRGGGWGSFDLHCSADFAVQRASGAHDLGFRCCSDP